MMSRNSFGPLGASTALAAALALLILAVPARAEDPIFPTGSRIGLVPPPGMVASTTFDGFADPGKDAAILITVLPAAAFAQMDKTLDLDTLKKQGVSLEKREPIQLSFGKGFLLIGRQTAEKTRYKKWLLVAGASDLTALVTVQVPEQESKAYPDTAVRAALATLSVRAKVPEAEELGLLPFAVGDLAGFQVEDVLRGRALMLRDTSDAKDSAKDAGSSGIDARMLIAALPGGPSEPDGRAQFRQVDVRRNRRDPGGERHAVGAAADRRPVGLPDDGGGQGRAHRRRRQGDPMAAFRRRRLSADGRHSARR